MVRPPFEEKACYGAGMDWDTYWRWELFRRRCDPLDFRRWKRDSARALATLCPGASLLDSTAGLGDHTVNLAEEGLRVEACDTSALALEATRAAITEASLEIPVFRADWRALDRPDRYDVIFNDAIHWTYEEQELRASLAGLFAALRPGGALVFFFADAAKPAPGAGLEILAWDWEHMEPVRRAWSHRLEDVQVDLTIEAARGEDFIDEHHTFEVHEGGARRREALTVRRVYRWDWHAMTRVLREVGFDEVRCDHFPNVKGHRFALNRAFKPR